MTHKPLIFLIVTAVQFVTTKQSIPKNFKPYSLPCLQPAMA
jgi:hypothetical protein